MARVAGHEGRTSLPEACTCWSALSAVWCEVKCAHPVTQFVSGLKGSLRGERVHVDVHCVLGLAVTVIL